MNSTRHILRRDQRAAALKSLIQSPRNNGPNLYTCLKDELMQLPVECASEVEGVLPHL